MNRHATIGLVFAFATLGGCSLLFGGEDYNPVDGTAEGGGGADGGAGGDGGVFGAGGGGGDGGSMGGGGATGGDGGTGGAPCETFADDFERRDSAGLGNGWSQKDGTFALSGGEVVVTTMAAVYQNAMTWQPGVVGVDAEASVELVPGSATPGWPNVMVRVQLDSVMTADVLDGYMFFRHHQNDNFEIARQHGSSFTTLATGFFGLTAGARYRMTFRATGTVPVVLTAHLHEDVNGSWVERLMLTSSDNDSSAITTEGSVGVTTHNDADFAFDNFTACLLP